jgi:hypothetical protein
MRIEKIANWANVIALIPGFYCAYGTYRLLHPPDKVVSADPLAGVSVMSLKNVGLSLFAAVFLVVLASVLNMIATYRRRASEQSGIQSVSKELASPTVKFDVAAFFQRAYPSSLYKEIESNMRIMATQYQAADREGFYLKFIAIGFVSLSYDMVWSHIYKSQLLLLQELNRAAQTLVQVRVYYDEAASANPNSVYSHYTFDQWMGFMKTSGLIMFNPSGLVVITIRGQDFLKYLTHWGRYPDDRKL